MNTTSHCFLECADAHHVAQLQSHIGAVHIMHAVTGGVVEYLLDKGDGDGEALASALLNANQILRNTLPDFALQEQTWPSAFGSVSDAAPESESD